MLDIGQAVREGGPLVVGVAGSRCGVGSMEVGAEECDLIELRLDVLGTGREVREFARRHRERFPILLTARHPAEGGPPGYDAASRAAAFRALMEEAAAIDLELRAIEELGVIWEMAGAGGLVRVASFHDFAGCPSGDELKDRIEAMRRAGADVCKLAFRIEKPRDLLTLTGVLEGGAGRPLAVMGMGFLAAPSRVLAARLGSVLNYGYLGEAATAPGQWPARLLKEAVAHIGRD